MSYPTGCTIADFCPVDSCEVRLHRHVRPDGWAYGSSLTPSNWDRAAFYLPTHSIGPVKELAVNIIVTGRTIQRDNGCNVVRVMIEFVGDGEPSTIVRGWMDVADTV